MLQSYLYYWIEEQVSILKVGAAVHLYASMTLRIYIRVVITRHMSGYRSGADINM